MNQSSITLNKFFFERKKDLSSKRLSALESVPRVVSLRGTILRDAKVVGWPATWSEIVGKMKDLLDIGIPEIMVSAWNKYQILLKYLDRKKYGPDETFLVPLAEHTIRSVHRPFIEVLINDQSVGKIQFGIDLSLHLKGIILKIQDGKIKEILTGSCKGKGILKCEDLIIMERETDSVPLPGSISLGEGLPITG